MKKIIIMFCLSLQDLLLKIKNIKRGGIRDFN